MVTAGSDSFENFLLAISTKYFSVSVEIGKLIDDELGIRTEVDTNKLFVIGDVDV